MYLSFQASPPLLSLALSRLDTTASFLFLDVPLWFPPQALGTCCSLCPELFLSFLRFIKIFVQRPIHQKPPYRNKTPNIPQALTKLSLQSSTSRCGCKTLALKTEDFGTLVWAAITITTDWRLKQHTFIFRRPGGWKPGIRASAWSGGWYMPSSWCTEGCLAVSSHGGKSQLVLWPLLKGTNPISEGSTLMT